MSDPWPVGLLFFFFERHEVFGLRTFKVCRKGRVNIIFYFKSIFVVRMLLFGLRTFKVCRKGRVNIIFYFKSIFVVRMLLYFFQKADDADEEDIAEVRKNHTYTVL